jgi:polar amino acid transport system substrate-binding protein
MKTARGISLTAGLLGAALLLSGCAAATDKPAGTGGGSSADVKVDAAAAALLPDAITKAGTIVAATAVGYEPYEFKDDAGEFAGLDIDLGHAIGDVLGVKVDFQDASYDSITGGVKSGRYNISLTAYTASLAKQKENDLVDYATSKLSILVRKGNPAGIDGLAGLCGTRVGVEKGSSADLAIGDYIDSGACAKPIDFKVFPVQADAVTALQSDRVDAVVVQSVSGNYVANANKPTKGLFEIVNDASFPATSISIVVNHDLGLTDAIVAALKSLQADGTFQAIFDKYGVGDAALTGAAVNSATK